MSIFSLRLKQRLTTVQFAIDGFHTPLRLNVTDKSGGLLVYVRSYLPLRQLTKHKISSNIQALVFEMNLRKEKWFFLSIHKPPSQNCQYFLDSLHNIIDFYSGIYDNHIVLGDFNMDPSHTQLSAFMEHYNYYNLIKNNTCFKGNGSYTDLILTNRKYCFKNTSSFETGISDHHDLIYSILKTTFAKEESKKVTYRNYKQFQWETFEKDLTSSLRNCNGEYENYEQNFMKVLNTHAPKKVKIVRGNHKPHYYKKRRKAIMKRSRLKNKAKRTKTPIDIVNYKKQRDLVVSLNRQAKYEYFNEVSNSESSRPFWETCKPYFSNKHARGDSKIMFIENYKMLLKNEEVGKVFNQFFGHITDSLDLYEFPDEKVCEGLDDIDNIVYKFRNHPSIVKIKEQYKVKSNFSFRLATTEEIKAIIRDLSTNKAAGGEIPVNILKKSNFSFDELTKYVNYTLTNGKFPITLKNANATPVHKKDDPTDKINFRPVSVSFAPIIKSV